MFRCASIVLTVLLLINVPTSTAQKGKNSTKMTMLPKKQVIEAVSVFRFNLIALGGTFNMIFSLINLIFGLVNFYLIFGKYNSRLLQVAGKLDMAVEEMKNRDLHPKIKMGFSREILPNTPLLSEIMAVMKEPSPLFDNANGLLDGQKEARLRKQNQKEEKTGKTAKLAKSETGKSSAEGKKKKK